MQRVKIKNERVLRLYALANAVNDATDYVAVTVYLGKYDAAVHITEMFDEAHGYEYTYYPDCGYERTDPDDHVDDENLTKAEAALLELLERAGGDV